MEPAFLDKLPPRFRKRWRDNLITIGVVAALLLIPGRCGDYGIVTFFTIAWAANSAYYLAKLRRADPAPSVGAFILLAVMTLAYGYPIIVGWFTKSFDAAGVLGFLIGTIALFALVIAYRRIVFPSIFGNERRGMVGEFERIRAAQREARAEAKANADALKDAHREPNKTNATMDER